MRALILLILIPNIALAQITIVCLGDSLTAGYGVQKAQAFPALIEEALSKKGRKVRVVNSGVSGSTTASGPKRFEWMAKSNPDILFLALGANDGLRGVAVKSSLKNLERVIKMAKAKSMTIILGGMTLPPNYGAQYIKQFESMYLDLAKKYKLIRIPFILKGVAGDKKLNLPDGIHPNVQGHKIIAKNILPFFKKALKEKY